MMMALAESQDRPVPLQLLFTIDEEAGMTGAIGLDPQALGLTGQQLINIDTEDDDEITIGAAGGRDAVLTWSGIWESVGAGECLSLSIDGLKGGHSGVEINQGRANANRLMARAIRAVASSCGARLVSFAGGSRRNAIPDTCTAIVAIPPGTAARVHEILAAETAQFNSLYAGRDNSVAIKVAPATAAATCLTTASTGQFVSILSAIPTGICEMTPEFLSWSNHHATWRSSSWRMARRPKSFVACAELRKKRWRMCPIHCAVWLC